MDNFDKLLALRPLLEHMGLPKTLESGEMLDIPNLLNQPLVKAYPLVRKFIEQMNTNAPDWDYSNLNKKIPRLLIDSFYYNETEEGKSKVNKGETFEIDFSTYELKVLDPEEPAIMNSVLLELSQIKVYSSGNYNVFTNGPYLKLYIMADEDNDYQQMELGLGFKTYLQYYMLNHYLNTPVRIPEGIDSIYDLIFDLVGNYKMGLITVGNAFFIIDELAKYLEMESVKKLYLTLDQLSEHRQFLVMESYAGDLDNEELYNELIFSILEIQDMLTLALEKKNNQTRTYKI